MSARGRFITLEGGEGAGKSTQATMLAAWLGGEGIDALTTREPGGSANAEVLRQFLLGGDVAPFGPDAEATFFAVARADHMRETIRPALLAGTWVICDRFFDSTWSYQGTAGADPEWLRRLDRVAVGDDRPDLTLILDLPAERGLSRLAGRGDDLDRFEADEAEAHEARRQAFREIAAREPERCVVIDASASEDAVADAIRAVVRERLNPVAAGG